MVNLRTNIQEEFPFITVLEYGGVEYVGIIINQDHSVTSFYDINCIKTDAEKLEFLKLGEIWWWESNRQFPISIFLKSEMTPFKYVIKTFNSKDVRIILGPVVNLQSLIVKRIKRKNVQLIRRPKK